MEYYERIKELRIQHQETQREVAALLQTSQQAYMKYEKGINEMPIWRLVLVCRHYQVSADYILGLSEEKTK